MADLNPLTPGDVPYPQYSVTTTEPISDGLQIVKGVLYEKDAAGRLVIITSTLVKGVFQAKATPLLPAVVANDDKVQVLGPRTRMIFTTQIAGIFPGEKVFVVPNTTDVTNVIAANLSIGRVFEIYTRDLDSTKKLITDVGDRVVVETVGPEI